MITHLLAFGLGLYLAWYTWPMPPGWLTVLKTKLMSWANK